MGKKRGDPPPVQPQPQAHVVTEIRDYTLITPLFGGGAITGEPDEVTVIRGTEIRGQLRFWWRACYGGHYSNIEDMKKAEGQIWGKANEKEENAPRFAETIQIVVEPIQKGDEVPAFIKVPGKKQPQCDEDIPAYAAFPLLPTDTEPAKPIYKNVRFRLTISFPLQKQWHDQLQRDILGTLWVWETFGGVGARTRRGFGALKLDSVTRISKGDNTETREEITQTLPASGAVLEWISEKFTAFDINQKASEGVPSLSKNMLHTEQIYVMSAPFREAKYAWKTLIDQLRLFRQGDRWPDKQELKKLKDASHPSLQQHYQFHKAALGLPILFHFPSPKLGGEEVEFMLLGKEDGHDRLASSLILRPLACQNRQFVGLAILLENYPVGPENVHIKKKYLKNGRKYLLPSKQAKKL